MLLLVFRYKLRNVTYLVNHIIYALLLISKNVGYTVRENIYERTAQAHQAKSLRSNKEEP